MAAGGINIHGASPTAIANTNIMTDGGNQSAGPCGLSPAAVCAILG